MGPLAHGAAAIVLVVAVVAVAYGAQAPGLAVAEFAPTARETVEPPPTTVAAPGAPGANSGRHRASTTTTAPVTTAAGQTAGTPAVPTTKVARTRSCVGDPPRQTEDPMSPWCMAAIFEGDNGGATARGVSSTEIRVGVPSGWGSAERQGAIDALFAHFNQRYEFYGRRLVPVHLVGSASTPVDARARAAELASQGVFAAVTGSAEWNSAQATLPFELARQEVVTVVRNSTSWWSDRTLFDPLHPYIWSVYPSSEDVQANLGSFACTALAGHPASRAGDVALRATTRRFGIIRYGLKVAPPTSVLATALEGCTDARPVEVDLTGTDANTRRAAIERLRDAGATTVICVCESGVTGYDTAHTANFHPEWVITPGVSASGNDEQPLQSPVAQGQLPPPIRLGSGPKLLPIQARPWYQMLQGMMPGAADLRVVLSMGEFVYDELLVIAAGVQAAGPMLTADTFAQGLMGAQFANVGAGQAPFWQPTAGFGPGDHSLYDDYNIAWWSADAEALDLGLSSSPKGSWCYLQQGARFSVGNYPGAADALLFDRSLPCR